MNDKACKRGYIKDVNFQHIIKKVKSNPCGRRKYLPHM